jgi:hypothetical protein
MQRLSNITQEMHNPLQSIRTLQIFAIHQLTHLHSVYALLQDLCLVGNGRNHTTAFRAVTVVIDVTVIGSIVGRVDPVPLIAESAFRGVGVVVCPGCCEADAVVVVRLEYLVENGLCGGG